MLDLLYKKSAATGMSWWKKRATEQAKVVAAAQSNPEEALAELKCLIENVSVSHGGESAATLVFGELSRAIGNKKAAKVWLRWAEEKSLLLRGTSIKCQRCQREAWRPVSELGTSIICDGCARPLSHPFEPTSLPFSYRLGESLRRAIEMDSIYHLLVMRAIRVILESGVEKVVGLHPGVDFRNEDGEQLEADVLVAMEGGDLLACEVKHRSTGLKATDIEHSDRLARWLGNPTVLFACGDTDQELAPIFTSAATVGGDVWRRLLTADDWLAPNPNLNLNGRYPGPDVCQPGADVPPRSKLAGDHEAKFADLLLTESL
ncbi:hypothetical protein [Amycolatopsis sp. NPDC004625]|uniref:hypothetical protein n=1 Tax=Amycolatopsis sp. NPDC004625 TaxID=3154670 RepID=UPI0033A6C08E